MPLARTVASALSCALLATAGSASAEQATGVHVALDYAVDPALSDCPSAADLSVAIGKQLGYDPFAAATGQSAHRVKASIERTPAGTEAYIEWFDERGDSEGQRRLSSEASDCAEIARGLGFALAVQIQLHAAPHPDAPRQAPEPAHPKQPAAIKKPPPPRPARPIIMVGAGALSQHGLTPGITPGLRVFGAIGDGLGSLELSTEATLPADYRRPDHTGFQARELSARVAPCLRLSFVGLCAVGMLGQLHVRGEGVDRVQSPSAVVAAAGARLQLIWPALPAFGVLLQAEALALLTSRTIVLNREDAWSTAPVVLGASVDLAAIFR